MKLKTTLVVYFIAFFSHNVNADNPWDPRKHAIINNEFNNYTKFSFGIGSLQKNKLAPDANTKALKDDTSFFGELGIGKDNLFQENLEGPLVRGELMMHFSGHQFLNKQSKVVTKERYRETKHDQDKSYKKKNLSSDDNEQSNSKENGIDSSLTQSGKGKIVGGKAPYSEVDNKNNSSSTSDLSETSDRSSSKKINDGTEKDQKKKQIKVEKDTKSTKEVVRQTNIKTTAVMANVYMDLTQKSTVTPFIGGGIGVANHQISEGNSNQTNLSWNVGGGVAIALSPRAKIDFSYRYLDMGKVSIKMKDQVTHMPLRSHQFVAGLRYYF